MPPLGILVGSGGLAKSLNILTDSHGSDDGVFSETIKYYPILMP